MRHRRFASTGRRAAGRCVRRGRPGRAGLMARAMTTRPSTWAVSAPRRWWRVGADRRLLLRVRQRLGSYRRVRRCACHGVAVRVGRLDAALPVPRRCAPGTSSVGIDRLSAAHAMAHRFVSRCPTPHMQRLVGSCRQPRRRVSDDSPMGIGITGAACAMAHRSVSAPQPLHMQRLVVPCRRARPYRCNGPRVRVDRPGAAYAAAHRFISAGPTPHMQWRVSSHRQIRRCTCKAPPRMSGALGRAGRTPSMSADSPIRESAHAHAWISACPRTGPAIRSVGHPRSSSWACPCEFAGIPGPIHGHAPPPARPRCGARQRALRRRGSGSTAPPGV